MSQTVDGITAVATPVGASEITAVGFGSVFGNVSALGGSGGIWVPVRIDFSEPMSSVDVWFWDGDSSEFEHDNDGFVHLQGYDLQDELVDEVWFDYTGGWTPYYVEVDGNLSYVVAESTGDVLNSLGWDNIDATPVPEPTSIGGLGFAGVALMLCRRARSREALTPCRMVGMVPARRPHPGERTQPQRSPRQRAADRHPT